MFWSFCVYKIITRNLHCNDLLARPGVNTSTLLHDEGHLAYITQINVADVNVSEPTVNVTKWRDIAVYIIFVFVNVTKWHDIAVTYTTLKLCFSVGFTLTWGYQLGSP